MHVALFQCGTCDKPFEAGKSARDNHCRSTGHSIPDFECYSCPRFFGSKRAREQHMEDTNHCSFECDICDDIWPTEEARADHEAEEHYYCAQHERHFSDYNSVKMHRNSNAHRGHKLNCPICEAPFVGATGLTHHLESGSCPKANWINRDQVYRLVRSVDPKGVYSKKLIDWVGSATYEVDDQLAWNGLSYECILCHRTFTSLQGLNQHINSPLHQQALYHCPNPVCRKDFKTLAGFFNHAEFESCGYFRYNQVQKTVGNVLSGDRLIGFK